MKRIDTVSVAFVAMLAEAVALAAALARQEPPPVRPDPTPKMRPRTLADFHNQHRTLQ